VRVKECGFIRVGIFETEFLSATRRDSAGFVQQYCFTFALSNFDFWLLKSLNDTKIFAATLEHIHLAIFSGLNHFTGEIFRNVCRRPKKV